MFTLLVGMSEHQGQKKWLSAMRASSKKQGKDPELIKETQEGFCEAVDDHFAWVRTKNKNFNQLTPQLRALCKNAKKLDDNVLIWLLGTFNDVLAGHRSPFFESTGTTVISPLTPPIQKN